MVKFIESLRGERYFAERSWSLSSSRDGHCTHLGLEHVRFSSQDLLCFRELFRCLTYTIFCETLGANHVGQAFVIFYSVIFFTLPPLSPTGTLALHFTHALLWRFFRLVVWWFLVSSDC